MDPFRPELYLDPLLPLHVRRDPAAFPGLAHAGARGVLVCTRGTYTVVEGSARTELAAPGIMRTDLSVDVRLARGCARSGACGGWLIVLGGRLLDQLIVGTFGDPGFSRFLAELDRPGRSACESLDAELDSGLAELSAELAERRPAYRVRARSLLASALLLLYRSALVAPALSDGDGMRLGAVLDHIELHYAESLTLSDLAELMGTSPGYFSRLFRSEVGMPLFEHINRTRVRKACLLLRTPELAITRIAFDVGYNSVSFFNRYFRRIMGMSPREYRRYLNS